MQTAASSVSHISGRWKSRNVYYHGVNYLPSRSSGGAELQLRMVARLKMFPSNVGQLARLSATVVLKRYFRTELLSSHSQDEQRRMCVALQWSRAIKSILFPRRFFRWYNKPWWRFSAMPLKAKFVRSFRGASIKGTRRHLMMTSVVIRERNTRSDDRTARRKTSGRMKPLFCPLEISIISDVTLIGAISAPQFPSRRLERTMVIIGISVRVNN